MSGPAGVIYLLHFDQPLEHAQHYVGFCERLEGVDSRMQHHQNGRGSKLLKAVTEHGIDFHIVRLWKGTRSDERAIKNGGHSPQFCPRCYDTPRRRLSLEEIQL